MWEKCCIFVVSKERETPSNINTKKINTMKTTRRQTLINCLNNLISENPSLSTIIEIKETSLTMNVAGECAIFHFAKTNDYYIINLLSNVFVENTSTLSEAKRYIKKNNL